MSAWLDCVSVVSLGRVCGSVSAQGDCVGVILGRRCGCR